MWPGALKSAGLECEVPRVTRVADRLRRGWHSNGIAVVDNHGLRFAADVYCEGTLSLTGFGPS